MAHKTCILLPIIGFVVCLEVGKVAISRCWVYDLAWNTRLLAYGEQFSSAQPWFLCTKLRECYVGGRNADRVHPFT